MKETKTARINRLRGKKADLLGKINNLLHGDPKIRNRMHKIDVLNIQVLNIVNEIRALTGRKSK